MRKDGNPRSTWEKPTGPKHSFDKRAKHRPILRHVPARRIQGFERWYLGRSKDISQKQFGMRIIGSLEENREKRAAFNK